MAESRPVRRRRARKAKEQKKQGWEALLTEACIAAEYHEKQLDSQIGEKATDTYNHWKLRIAARTYADYPRTRKELMSALNSETQQFMCLGAKDETWSMSHIVWMMNGLTVWTANGYRTGDDEVQRLCVAQWRCLLRHFDLCVVDGLRGPEDKYPRVFSAHSRSIVPGPGQENPANQVTYAGECRAWFRGEMKRLPSALRRALAAGQDPPLDYFWLAMLDKLQKESKGWLRTACADPTDDDLLRTRTAFFRSTWPGGMQNWFSSGEFDGKGMLRPAWWCRVEWDPSTMMLTSEEYGTDPAWRKTQKAATCTGPYREIPDRPKGAIDKPYPREV